MKKIACDKCQGTGRIEYFQHVENGKCFKCHGTGLMNEPRKSKHSSKPHLSAAYLAQVNAEEALVKVEYEQHALYPAFVKQQLRDGWQRKDIENRVWRDFHYYAKLDDPFTIAKARLAARGIAEDWTTLLD